MRVEVGRVGLLPSESETDRAWRWPLSDCVVRDRQRRENHRDGQKTVVMILCTPHCTLYMYSCTVHTSPSLYRG